MRLASFIALASAAVGTLAHLDMYVVWVNNIDQGNGRGIYIRSPPSNYPIKDLTSPNLRCNVNGDKAVPKSISVKYGDKLTFEWGHHAPGDDIIDPSHKGPILVYMAPASGNGNWTKVFEANFNGVSWATERLRDARGQHSIFIPDVPAGDYLFRAEVLALHEADTYYTNDPARGVQLFPACVQVKVTSNGQKALPAGGAVFPGTYKNSSPGIFFNLYKGGPHASYYSPGPVTWYEAKLKDGYIGQVGTPRSKRFVAALPVGSAVVPTEVPTGEN